MKKLISFIITILIVYLSVPSFLAATIGNRNVNIYRADGGFIDPAEYDSYLANLKKERGTTYSSDELKSIYNQISFYTLNRNSIKTSDSSLELIMDSIRFIGIRDDDDYNCVEVIIDISITEKGAQMFSDYICDSDAVVIWECYSPTAPSYEDIDLKAKRASEFKLKAGQTVSLPIASKSSVKLWKSSDPNVLSVTDGTVTALKSGTALITAVYNSAVEVTLPYRVTSSPTITCKDKAVSSVTVKKGKTVSLSIGGKAKSVNNKYKSSKKAKIISSVSASTIKIKGLKKGKTTLTVTVNKSVVFKIKVKVTSTTIKKTK